MRKRIWKHMADSYHEAGVHGRLILMVGTETHIRYIWHGRVANIHGTIIIMRSVMWRYVKWQFARLIRAATKIWA